MTTITFRPGSTPTFVPLPRTTSQVRPPGTTAIAVVPVVGPAGPAGSTYSHHQVTPAATWLVTHNLGTPREPTVLLADAPTEAVYADVEHPDSNTTLITFPEPVTGWAHL